MQILFQEPKADQQEQKLKLLQWERARNSHPTESFSNNYQQQTSFILCKLHKLKLLTLLHHHFIYLYTDAEKACDA